MTGPGRFGYLGAWAGVVGYLAALLTSISLPGMSVFMWVLVGMLARPLSTRTVTVGVRSRTLAAAALAVIVPMAIFISYRAVAADALFLQARVAARTGGDDAGLMREVVRLNPVPQRYQFELELAESLESGS